MRFELLADKIEALPLVCRWYFEEWGDGYDGTLDSLTSHIRKKYINSREVPLMILCAENDEVIGACQLKFREMKMFPDYEHWLGGVFVSQKHRGKGIGRLIVSHAASVAATHSIVILYLQTEDLSGGIYAQLGWAPIELVEDDGKTVLVMKRQIGVGAG